MKLILKSSKIQFLCKEDLAKAIPEECSGQPLNYGQGEGQVEINDTLWGFYVNEMGDYYMALEEGAIGWIEFQSLVQRILETLSVRFSTSIELIAKGAFTESND